PQVIRSPGGMNIGNIGVVIDASYDPRLDTLVPGYKVINVVLVNQSFNIIFMDPEGDKWQIKMVDGGKPINAVHDLRRYDPKAWAVIPERAKRIMGYPLALPVGAREVIDLFVPDSVDVQNFNELDIFLKSINIKLEVLVRQ
ncbi:MAG: hypothetical protein WC956_08765, partial [bacterium]